MSEKGFFGSLFDFSFADFVFPKIIRVLYAIAVCLTVLGYLGGVVYAFKTGSTEGIAAVVLGPIVLMIYLVMIRAWMEIAIVLFRIYENTNVIARK